jgi:hypothetical protein
MAIPPDPHDDDTRPAAPPSPPDPAPLTPPDPPPSPPDPPPSPPDPAPLIPPDPPPSPAYRSPTLPVTRSGRVVPPGPAGTRADNPRGGDLPDAGTGVRADVAPPSDGRSGGDAGGTDGHRTDAGADRRVPPTVPPTRSRIPGGPAGIVLAAIVAVIAIAGVVVLTGGDDTAAPEQEVAGDGGDVPDDDGPSPDSEPATADEGVPDDDGAPDDTAGADVDVPEPSADSPVEATEAFLAAVAEADCVEIIAWLTPDTFESAGQTSAQAIVECANDPTSAEALGSAEFGAVSLVSEDGDEATVAVEVTLDGVQDTREFVLRRVDGEWRFDLLASDTGGG